MSRDVGMAAQQVRAPLAWTPFCPIVHFSHHKVGTVWFGNVLRHMSDVTAAPFERMARVLGWHRWALGFTSTRIARTVRSPPTPSAGRIWFATRAT